MFNKNKNINYYKNKIVNLENELLSLRNKVAELEAENESLKNKSSELLREVDDMRINHDAALSEYNDGLKEAYIYAAQAKEAVDSLKILKKDYESRIKVLLKSLKKDVKKYGNISSNGLKSEKVYFDDFTATDEYIDNDENKGE